MCGVHLFGQQHPFSSPSPQKQDAEKSPVLLQVCNDEIGLKSCFPYSVKDEWVRLFIEGLFEC
jgi:hypothetical protein